MQTNNFSNLNEFLKGWSSNDKYFEMLGLMASLSKLFSENDVPYLDYRLTENLFCKYYNAINDARSCTAYDARFSNLGIGIKTFILKNNASTEKIAEFNKLRPYIANLKGKELACKLAEFRNQRMQFADDTFNISESQYHIVGRSSGLLRVFNVPYERINIENICNIKDKDNSFSFEDDKNFYSFNRSKTVLMKRFVVPENYRDVAVDILSDPLILLEKLLTDKPDKIYNPIVKGYDYVILPLYSTKQKGELSEKSGLNQWNAGGRLRNVNEVYIPVPVKIHQLYPDFFPPKDQPFELQLPDGKKLSAKICQANGKALMSNPNSDLGEWLLRKILKKKEGSLVTKFDLDTFGFDSIMVVNTHRVNEAGLKIFRLEFTENQNNFQEFIK
ncbi:MAG: NgoFVII family restriction endonuclease [Bacteroidales bacterium]|nr:NgoFVII family restriction endonuclease [Bacteroidales bacterium]